MLVKSEQAKRVPQGPISVCRRHVQYIKNRYRRTGTLRDGRYESSLAEAEPYLLLCPR